MTLRRGFCLSEFLLLILIFFLSSSSLSAQSPNNSAVPTQIPGRDAILMGTDWYPEQWPEARWEEDLRLIEAANLDEAIAIAKQVPAPLGGVEVRPIMVFG